MTPFATAISDAWAAELASERRARPDVPRDYVYASQRRACVRAMALDLIHPEDSPELSDASLERMRRGNARERDITATLGHVGRRCDPRFAVIEQQRRFEIKDRDGTVLIVGKVDGVLLVGDGSSVIYEVKSGDSIRHVETLADLDRGQWTRHYADQLLAYMLASSIRHGMLILDRPDGPRFVPLDLEGHLDRAESFLVDARAAVDARRGGQLPAYHGDQSECRRCDHFGRSCAPPIDYGAGAAIIADEAVIDDAETVMRTRDAAKEHDAAWKRLTERLRGVETALVGECIASGKWQGAKRVEVPDEIKAQYTTHDPHARFVLTLDKI